MKKFWTQEKEKLLKEKWEELSDDDLAILFGTTTGAIQTKRRRLGLKRKSITIHNTKIYNYEEAKQIFLDKGYTLLEDIYVNYTTKMRYVCNRHRDAGVQAITLCDLLRGRGCMQCGRERTADSKKLPDSYYIEECKKKDFEYVGRYIRDNNTIIQYICNKHRHLGVQEKHVANFGKTYGCPSCRLSRGENVVKDILLKWNYKFTQQKRFDDCKDVYTLPFDFYLEDFNVLIEYDGEFHYQPIKLGDMTNEDAESRFKSTQSHDSIKNEYCYKNNIPLIRIPYWELDNLECFLFDHFKECKIIA